MLSNNFFIIGTDTDIGKTYISALFFKALKDLGGMYFKPIQSGGEDGVSPDVKFVCEFSSVEYNNGMAEAIFSPAVSPHYAAKIENSEIDSRKILYRIKENTQKYPFNIVEAAGGICVPLNIEKNYFFHDLIKESNLPVVLVSSCKVGTINHTLLTVSFLEKVGVPIIGIIFNNCTDKDFENDNIKTILACSKIKNHLVISKNQKEIDLKSVFNFLKI